MGYPAVRQRPLLDEDWRYLRHFTQGEVAAACEGGAWQNLDAGSLFLLDQFAGYLVGDRRLLPSVQFMPTRTAAGVPTATWNTQATRAHARDSLHYEGRAFDVMFPRSALATAWLTALRFPKWGGVGAYPYWRPDPGLHLDTRTPHEYEQGRGFRVLWWVAEDGKYHYLTSEQDIVAFLALLRVTA